MIPLTQQLHERLKQNLQPGDLAIDATAGNGHDTLFLAQQVGPRGRVMAFDIQEQAIKNTRERLQQHAIKHVELIHSGHENMLEHVPRDWHQNVSAIVFNLGYLPGSTKEIVTQPQTTIDALNAAALLLKPGACLTVMVYRGHDGGRTEHQAIENWLALSKLRVECQKTPGPFCYYLSAE